MATTTQQTKRDMGPAWRAAWDAASKRYLAALDRVDPDHEDGVLGVSVRQDSRYAVDDEIRTAATDMVRLMDEHAAAPE